MRGRGVGRGGEEGGEQYLGAKRPDLSERANAHCARMATLLMSVLGVACALLSKPLMRLFTSEPEMIAIGVQAIWVVTLAWPPMAIAQVLAGSLRGAGDTRFPMYTTFLGIWLIRLPLGYLFGPMLGWGLAGLYLALIADSAARALVFWWRYRGGAWREMEV